MFRKIPAVNYKTKEVKEIEISVFDACAAPGGCKEKPSCAIIFDEPYVAGEDSVQGEVYFCDYHQKGPAHHWPRASGFKKSCTYVNAR